MDLNLTQSSHEMFTNYMPSKIKYFFIFCITVLILLPLVIPSNPSFALQVISGNQIAIQEPVKDDSVIFGETVQIDAPIRGAIIFANNIIVNAPIDYDLFAVGGQITVNSDVSGKIVAAGKTIDLGGKSTNAILAANNILFDLNSVIIKDAYVAGGTIYNNGNISGQLVAMTENFQNNGTVGDLKIMSQKSMIPDIEGWLSLFGILFVIGFAILGVILVKLLPIQLEAVRTVMRKSLIKNTLIGFLLIILFVVVIILSAITVIGLPVAAFGILVLLVGLILSSLVVSFVIGKKILELLGRKSSRDINNITSFLIGFVILNLLYIVPIPYFGQVAQTIVISMGFGTIYYAVRKSQSQSHLSF